MNSQQTTAFVTSPMLVKNDCNDSDRSRLEQQSIARLFMWFAMAAGRASSPKTLPHDSKERNLTRKSPTSTTRHARVDFLAQVHPAVPQLHLPTLIQSPTITSSPKFSTELQQYFDIYCRGPLLHTIQSIELFDDCKDFVDMPIKRTSSATQALQEFEQRRLALDHFDGVNVDQYRARLREFLNTHFDKPGSDLVPFSPLDYQEHALPPKMEEIQDPTYRDWAFALHKLWKSLGRLPDPSMKGSFLHAKPISSSDDNDEAVTRPENVLIVPGGRFRESYYWDSYWIVHGLLISDMALTARGIVNNLLEYVQEFGFVPNGGRIYYLTRSQPPMLSEMVKLVAAKHSDSHSNTPEYDAKYLKMAVKILEKEYAFWMQQGPGGHAVTISVPNPVSGHEETHVLNRFVSSAEDPRPESYREDVHVTSSIIQDANLMASPADTQAQKARYYREVIAATESGWDFSSRWLSEQDKSDMRTMETSNVVPVDLNAVMYRMEKNLMEFHEYLGDSQSAKAFDLAAQRRAKAIDAVLWSETHQSWRDFVLTTQSHSSFVSVSDYAPLWANAFDHSDQSRNHKIIASLVNSGLIQPGGVQTTTLLTGQQWDSPNAWPPEQDLLIEGLLNMDTTESKQLASHLAKTWVGSGLKAWQKTGLMFEKYNASESGKMGAGGEYLPQFGFGWTNGVILKFLTKHQNLLSV